MYMYMNKNILFSYKQSWECYLKKITHYHYSYIKIGSFYNTLYLDMMNAKIMLFSAHAQFNFSINNVILTYLNTRYCKIFLITRYRYYNSYSLPLSLLEKIIVIFFIKFNFSLNSFQEIIEFDSSYRRW